VQWQERLVVLTEADRCENPIFLIGLHRSGSTLLRLYIDSHSRIACPPESFFFGPLKGFYESKATRDGMSALGYDLDTVRRRTAEFAGSFLEPHRISREKARWAEKTPSYGFYLDFMHELWPDAQYVMIYRHPFDIMASLLRLGWDFMKYDQDPFLNVAKYCRAHLDAQLAFTDEHPGKTVDVRYEDLTREPEPVLRQMFEFLHEPWEEQVLRYYEQPHDMGIGDPRAQQSKGVQASKRNWDTWTDSQIAAATEVLNPVMQRLAYPTSATVDY